MKRPIASLLPAALLAVLTGAIDAMAAPWHREPPSRPPGEAKEPGQLVPGGGPATGTGSSDTVKVLEPPEDD